jgi:hypothetical protein
MSARCNNFLPPWSHTGLALTCVSKPSNTLQNIFKFVNWQCRQVPAIMTSDFHPLGDQTISLQPSVSMAHFRKHGSELVALVRLKTLDTIGNCQRPVFSLRVSQHMHKTTNLWKFELNRSSKLRDNSERKNTLVTGSCVLLDASFRDLKF